MTKPVWILNGPNLNLLGTRAPEIYGTTTLADIASRCRTLGEKLMAGRALECRQTNDEGTLVTWVQEARDGAAGLIVNAGAYTHTSLALGDALEAYDGPVIEVHISNVHTREPIRHHSFVSPHADGIIVGCGAQGYELAVHRLASLLNAS